MAGVMLPRFHTSISLPQLGLQQTSALLPGHALARSFRQFQGRRALRTINGPSHLRTTPLRPSLSWSSSTTAALQASSHRQERLLSEDSKPKRQPDEHDDVDRQNSQSPQSPLKQPVTRTLEAARERTQAVRNKVRSSLTSLTPHENIYNLPNFLTVTRLVAAPVTAYLLLHDHHAWALGLFAYAGITDWVDGYLARKWKLQTVAGSVMDPMADKALMIILTITLAVKGALPAYLATLILGRDASLALAALYYRFASLPAPKTFMRYWDFSLPSAEVHPTTVSKYNTLLQLVLIGSTLALPVLATAQQQPTEMLQFLGLNLHNAMIYFQWVVAATTAWSGLSYAYLKNAVTIIGSDERLKAKQGARGRAIIGVTFGSVVIAAAWSALRDSDKRTPDGTTKQVERSV